RLPDRAGSGEPDARRALDERVAPGHGERHRFLALAALAPAELLHQLTGVDRHRTGAQAASVGRARLQGVVLVVGQQRLIDRRALRLARHLAPDHDSLARGGGGVAARADRLAEPALDAVRGALLDLGLGLQVLEVDAGVAVEHHS